MNKGLRIMVAQMATAVLVFLTIVATISFSSTLLYTDSYLTTFGISVLYSIGLFIAIFLMLLIVEHIYKHF